ncbi:MAG: hypothetical protein ACR2IE_04630 [Candidatus Sumerlaeaceae bacterium]
MKTLLHVRSTVGVSTKVQMRLATRNLHKAIASAAIASPAYTLPPEKKAEIVTAMEAVHQSPE